MSFTAWSPSSLEKYEACPLSAKLQLIDKLCTECFKGRLSGGFDKPLVCGACKKTIQSGPALERGSAIGKVLDAYVKGEVDKPPKEIKNEEVLVIAKSMRDGYKKGTVESELSLAFDRNWDLVDWFSPNAWLRAKLDILQQKSKKLMRVIDWKTGGIDKRTGAVRAMGKYADQLSIYTLAALCARPSVPEAEAFLVFVDALTPNDPVLYKPEADLVQAEVKAQQTKWTLRVQPMMRDEKFNPKPSADSCRFCPFKKSVGGPCIY